MIGALRPAAQQLLDLAASGLPRPAIDFALDLMSTGQTVDELIVEVLAPVQQRVGARWEANQWNIAAEHAATAVVDGVLGAVGLQTTVPSPPRGSVLVACVEQEYHILPARMGVERLRAAGWDVAFLGGGLPADDLQRFAAVAEPDVVILSCTMALNLPGGARCITAIAELGLPAVAAGAGFGTTPERANRVGASAWIGPGADPGSVLSRDLDPARPAPPAHPEAVALELQDEDLQSACLAAMADRFPPMAAYSPRQLAHIRSDLGYILRYLAVAIDLDDGPLFDGFLSWLAGILRTRAVPGPDLGTSLEVVGDVVARAGLRQAAATCSSARGERQQV